MVVRRCIVTTLVIPKADCTRDVEFDVVAPSCFITLLCGLIRHVSMGWDCAPVPGLSSYSC